MYDARRATGWGSVFFFVSLIILGMMIVMNLFLAILLSNFTNKDDVDNEVDVEGTPGGGGEGRGNAAIPRVTPYYPASPPASPTHSQTIVTHAKNHEGGGAGGEGSAEEMVDPTENGGEGKGCVDDQLLVAEKTGVVGRTGAAVWRVGKSVTEACANAFIKGFQVPDDLDQDKALLVLGPQNPLRRVCAAIVANPGFDRFILLLISVSSLALALDNPLRDPSSRMAIALDHVERVMTGLFFAEMVLKICAHGFLFMRGAYLRNIWNILDFVVVVISMVQLFNDSGNLESLRSLRTLRALRPLRYVRTAL